MALSDQERQLLEEVYKCRGLLLEQVRVLLMNGSSKWSVYKRLQRLEDGGYIRKEPHFVNGRRKSSFVYLGDAGLREMGEERARARDLVERRMQQVWATLADIYFSLKPYGWEYLEGRLAKKEHNLNRNARLNGLLRAGISYGVYLLLSEAPRPETLKGIEKDIQHCIRHGITSFMIFHSGEAVPEYFSGSAYGAYRLLLLPYPEGVKRVAHFLTPGALEKWFNLLVLPVEGFRKVAETFAEYLVKQGSREHYVTELVTNDVAKQYHLEQYGLGRAKETGRGVYIFVPAGTEEKWREKYPEKRYPHFRFIPVTLEGIS
jgi:DNA-binding MarR family transcriptional regulator